MSKFFSLFYLLLEVESIYVCFSGFSVMEFSLLFFFFVDDEVIDVLFELFLFLLCFFLEELFGLLFLGYMFFLVVGSCLLLGYGGFGGLVFVW